MCEGRRCEGGNTEAAVKTMFKEFGKYTMSV